MFNGPNNELYQEINRGENARFRAHLAQFNITNINLSERQGLIAHYGNLGIALQGTGVTELDISFLGLDEAQIMPLITALAQGSAISKLNISGNLVGNNGVSQILRLLENQLVELNAANTNVNAQILTEFPHIKLKGVLDLRHNGLVNEEQIQAGMNSKISSVKLQRTNTATYKHNLLGSRMFRDTSLIYMMGSMHHALEANQFSKLPQVALNTIGAYLSDVQFSATKLGEEQKSPNKRKISLHNTLFEYARMQARTKVPIAQENLNDSNKENSPNIKKLKS